MQFFVALPLLKEGGVPKDGEGDCASSDSKRDVCNSSSVYCSGDDGDPVMGLRPGPGPL